MGYATEVNAKFKNGVDYPLQPTDMGNIVLRLETTNICNHACQFCPNRKLVRKRKFIESDLARRVIKEAAEMGVKRGGFFIMGEPLLNEETLDYYNYAKELGFDVLFLTTNGSLATEDKVKKIFDSGITSLKFSNLSRFDGIKYGLRGEGKNYQEMILDSRNKGFGDEVKRRILLGNYALSSGYFDAYYRKACALRQRIIGEYNAIFEKADLVLTPTAPTTAFKIGAQDNDPVKMYTADILTVPVNIAGLPAISTTCGRDKNGMPIGMSITGKKFDEVTVLQVADAFEREFNPIYTDK